MKLVRKDGWEPTFKDLLEAKLVLRLIDLGKTVTDICTDDFCSRYFRPALKAAVPKKDNKILPEQTQTYRNAVEDVELSCRYFNFFDCIIGQGEVGEQREQGSRGDRGDGEVGEMGRWGGG